ncbi:MAG: NgoFVII family restriction endonuclease [Bacilli bacterium]|nr:NgoFVII family restriction endonuclease [Bacilli bacterium]
MISIVKTPSKDSFFNLIKEANREMLFCAPFIKKEIVDEILKNRNPGVVFEVITSANLANFVNGSLDVEAIKTLLEAGIKVINFQNLHAKIYLFDNKKALVTSANLTNNALYNNYEYGLLLHEDEKETVDAIYSDFIMMMDSELCGSFDENSIKEIEKFVKKFNNNKLTHIDNEGDSILPIDESDKISNNLKGWKKDVFNCLQLLDKQDFTISDVYSFEDVLHEKHSTNNRVKPKIRQTLQYLRDLGFVKFVKPGVYKKLWINASFSEFSKRTEVQA